jgi:hypothetical protein
VFFLVVGIVKGLIQGATQGLSSRVTRGSWPDVNIKTPHVYKEEVVFWFADLFVPHPTYRF